MAQYEGYETILIEQQERVLRLTMNRPEALNAFDAQMHEEMSRIFSEIHDDDGTTSWCSPAPVAPSPRAAT